jgi:GTP-binding protein
VTPSASTPDTVAVAPVRPVVAIVGRPNVGKSTFFNRITGTRKAITDDRPGVTRDRIHAMAEWGGRHFTLVDTGGYVPGSDDEIETQVRRQAEQALQEADVVLLLCEAGEGATAIDREVAGLLRRRSMPCLLVVNKVDHPDASRYDLSEFYGLGLGDPHPVSAANGRRSGDLLEALVERFADVDDLPEVLDSEEVRIVLAGRPNVGKSTLINRLSGEEISIVHDQPGTTRDSTDVTIVSDGRRFVLVDTAGMRRRARVQDPVEYFSALRASHSIERADVVVVLVDAVEGTTAQDARIMAHVTELGRGLVVAVNKWDLVAGKEGVGIDTYRSEMRRRHPFLSHFPILTLSALTGRRAARCLAEAAAVAARARSRISTPRLNRWVEEMTQRLTPGGGRDVRLLYATQTGVAPPSFVVFSNRPDLISDSYRRFVENNLRDTFDMEGTPVRIRWRSSRSRRARGVSQEDRGE